VGGVQDPHEENTTPKVGGTLARKKPLGEEDMRGPLGAPSGSLQFVETPPSRGKPSQETYERFAIKSTGGYHKDGSESSRTDRKKEADKKETVANKCAKRTNAGQRPLALANSAYVKKLRKKSNLKILSCIGTRSRGNAQGAPKPGLLD